MDGSGDEGHSYFETDKASKLKGLGWLTAACLLGLLLGAGVSPLAHAIPWKWEKHLSGLTAPDDASFCGRDAATKALLDKILTRLYPLRSNDDRFSIDVSLLKNPEVNAYAGLGGHVFVFSGLLKQARSPEELAGILAHEIEHVRHRHIMERVIVDLFTVQGLRMIFSGDASSAGWANMVIGMDFSRAQEREADKGGLERLQKARIDNRGFVNFFERMERNTGSAFLSDHPDNRSRIDMAADFPNDRPVPVLTPDEWLALKKACR